MLVIAEHELTEVEKLFAKALNIEVKDENQPKSKHPDESEEMKERKLSSDLFKRKKLVQWRTLFYFKDF